MKRLTFLLLFIISSALCAQTLSEIVDSVVNTKVLKNAQWSMFAKYIDNNEIIYAKNQNFVLAPASGLKVFTSSAALSILGEEYRYKTKIFFDGKIIRGSILKGNIYIVGGGDPTLGSDLVKGSINLNDLLVLIYNAILEKGIRRIEGAVFADENLYEGNPISDGWSYGDMGNYYGAGCSALTINDNLYKVYFKPANKIGDEAKVLRTEPYIPNLTFTNYMKTGEEGSGDNGYIYSAPYQFNAILRGTIPAGVTEFFIKGSIPDPALFAAQILTKYLKDKGIEVKKRPEKLTKIKTYEEKNLITEISSPPLKDIVYIVNKRSNNLYTEMLLRSIGYTKNKKGTIESGINALKIYFTENGIDTEALDLADGCGLSRNDCITTKMMVDVLSLAYKQPCFSSFYNSLGVTGDPNDISYYSKYGVGTELAFNGRIKSGLINNVRSHSGYIKDKDGRTIVFSLIANNYNGSVSAIDKIHINLMVALARLKKN
jgi:D-alanyl-D-alanine carboxypeptidase/D-alanyl-D-alanine-endopeptidase (penicillin-binding protein 4)